MLSTQVNDTTNGSANLYIALELSGKCWKRVGWVERKRNPAKPFYMTILRVMYNEWWPCSSSHFLLSLA